MRSSDVIEDLVKRIVDTNFNNFSLMSGRLGRIVLLTTLKISATSFDDIIENDLKKAILFLDRFNYNNDTTFCNGMAGLGWVLKSLESNNYHIDLSKEYWEKINYCIKKSIDTDIKCFNYDFLHGAIGKLHYLRLNKDNNFNKLNKAFIKHLNQSKIKEQYGIAWHKPLINPILKEDSKGVKYDMGLAHGIPSILNYLTDIYSLEIERETVRKLINDSIAYLLSLKYKHTNLSVFPSFVFEDNRLNESRLAWCYGDLGIAYSICRAAIICERNDWLGEGIEIALKTCERKSHINTLIFDASLCHGAAGLTIIYEKLFEMTRNETFQSTNSYWSSIVDKMLLKTLNQYHYKFYDTKNGWEDRNGLLDGLIGTTLSILSRDPQCNKDWTSCLLI